MPYLWDADSNANGATECYTYGYDYSYNYAQRHTNGHSYGDGYGYTYRHGYSYGNSYSYSYCATDAHRQAQCHTEVTSHSGAASIAVRTNMMLL